MDEKFSGKIINIPIVSPAKEDEKQDIARSFYLSMVLANLMLAFFKSQSDIVADSMHIFDYEVSKGDTLACYYAGIAYFRNLDNSGRQGKGVNLLIKAMNAGIEDDGEYIQAIDCVRLGQFVNQDEKKAARLYRKLSQMGVSEGTYRLAYCYEWGIGVKKDSKKAEKLYEEAAKQGSIDAKSKIISDDAGELFGGKTRKWKYLLSKAPRIIEL